MGKEETHRPPQASAKERWTHPCGTKEAFATHESPVGGEKKSTRKDVVSGLGLIDFASRQLRSPLDCAALPLIELREPSYNHVSLAAVSTLQGSLADED